ncbi:hypothetical protein PENTCL1PPCAC_29342, partial [Pristionchus entomophagus]
MSGSQMWRLEEIECWREKAYTLSRMDRIGHLIMKTLEIAQMVIKDVPQIETLMFDLGSLSRENTKTMSEDPNRDNIIRYLMYGICASVGSMVESIIERRDEQKLEEYNEMNQLGDENVNDEIDKDTIVQGNFPETTLRIDSPDIHLSVASAVRDSLCAMMKEEPDELEEMDHSDDTSENEVDLDLAQTVVDNGSDVNEDTAVSNQGASLYCCDKCSKRFTSK